MPESAWSTARSALLLACFDDTLCEHDFQTIVGWPRSAFHALAAECEAMDVESLRAWLFRARAVEDGVRHRKLSTFALDHMGMEPSRKDVWLRTRLLAPSERASWPHLAIFEARCERVLWPHIAAVQAASSCALSLRGVEV